MELRLRGSARDAKRRDLRNVAQAGKKLEGLLGFAGQAVQLAHHEVDDIVGVALGVNAREVPRPSRRLMVKGEQPLFGKRSNELDREEWVASSLSVYQLCQRSDLLRFAVKRIRNQPAQI